MDGKDPKQNLLQINLYMCVCIYIYIYVYIHLKKNIPVYNQRLKETKVSIVSQQLVPCFFHRLLFVVILLAGRLQNLKVVENTVVSFEIDGEEAHALQENGPRAPQNDPRHMLAHTQGPGRTNFGSLFGSQFRGLEKVLRIGSQKAVGTWKSLTLFQIYTYG